MSSIDSVVDERTDDPETTESADLSKDAVFHILQTKRRREVLRYMRTAEEPVRLRELAEAIAAREQGTTVENLSSDGRQRVYISLYQSHLPKLDEEGIVDYDKDRGVVERTPLAATLDPYLEGEVGDEESDPWLRRYVGATVFGGAAVTVGATPLPPSPVAAGTIAVAGFAAVATVHAVNTSDRG